jgi:hypothetical protein
MREIDFNIVAKPFRRTIARPTSSTNFGPDRSDRLPTLALSSIIISLELFLSELFIVP